MYCERCPCASTETRAQFYLGCSSHDTKGDQEIEGKVRVPGHRAADGTSVKGHRKAKPIARKPHAVELKAILAREATGFRCTGGIVGRLKFTGKLKGAKFSK